jgi:hypothetical protein
MTMNRIDIERLFEIAEDARGRGPMDAANKAIVRDDIPESFADFRSTKFPARVAHPAGFTVSGAPVRTFTLAALLLCGQKALGKRFGGQPFYESRERDMAFDIMRTNFHHGHPRGTNCCAQCTLATLPVLRAGAVRYFDCKALANDVTWLIEHRQWRFSSSPNAKMLAWAMSA